MMIIIIIIKLGKKNFLPDKLIIINLRTFWWVEPVLLYGRLGFAVRTQDFISMAVSLLWNSSGLQTTSAYI